jgi:hypothetical protein
MKTSLNNNLILTPYKKTKELKTTQVATGFAVTANKVGVDFLELLVDAVIQIGNNQPMSVAKGARVYFKEETLHTQQWPRKVFESELFPEGFVVANSGDILFIDFKEEGE